MSPRRSKRDKLGDMNSELSPSEFISEFPIAGPKNYGYRVVKGTAEKTACKVRGIRLNFSASKLVNFEVIRDMILIQRNVPATVNVLTEKKTKRKRREGVDMYQYSPKQKMKCAGV